MRLSVIALALALPVPALAAPAPPLSWGKAGVSLATYRAESIGCSMRAYYTDVGGTTAAKTFVQGSRQLDTLLQNNSGSMLEMAVAYGRIVQAVNPDRGIKELKTFQLDLVSQCLRDHGYRRFQLSASQRKYLEKLKIGSDARHAYLHRLASDPGVLAAQGFPEMPRAAHP